ncbi:DUF6415 family natural product biosynthesis protein [Streptomyces sp. MUM 178J]|uniref:DUF6415 family natural product biosynthesis protein n=1 Tax=Streptomyces sp. MUM 178J TaxID=2791991 RepID=UPI001F0347F5|nr:DUF6415 family natural product biosynthesis protein [Streptomyces sp. MUM 178J]WRQ81163.1 DUF6415 family natural product biosynthesis protein [Streptomyces sp. MUM 178J]
MSSAASPARLNTGRMLADAEQLLDSTADGPSHDGLHELTLRLRGHIMQLIPAVTDRFSSWPRNDDTLAQAMAGTGRAQRQLAADPPDGSLTQAVAYAQRLARTVVELTQHLARLDQAGYP